MEKAAFLGPKAENAAELERLLLEVLHDHVFWRRNFQPGDPRLITERDKSGEEHREFVARLRDELFQILSELKRGAPLYSPRQIAHMVTDPSLPAIVGYFTGMLYNQNNVVSEVSPETVRKERDYVAALARMVGYPELLPERLVPGQAGRYSWGHLAGGGTVANLEALWVIRNLRFFPVSVRLLGSTCASARHLLEIPVSTPAGEVVQLGRLSTYELMMLEPAAALALRRGVDEDTCNRLPSIRKLGLAGFMGAYNDEFATDRLRMPRVLVSQAAHYGWRKAADITGLGVDALLELPVDRHFRLDMDALQTAFENERRDNVPVLAVVSICGTTEEGAIDPLHEIESVRAGWAAQGAAVWHHSDAAMGGYFASMLPRDPSGAVLPYEAAGEMPVSRDVYDGIAALARTDSVTIDPHKFGYVPYPCGTILFNDYEVRDFVAYPAPYLPTDPAAGFGGFLGQWTLEGSRPGAAAVSCYLAQAVVPLEPTGHGRLVRRCIEANMGIAARLIQGFAADDLPVRLFPISEPETTEFCFFVAPAEPPVSLEDLNRLNIAIWRSLSVDGETAISHYEFFVSKTALDVGDYAHVIDPILAEAGVSPAAPGGRPTLTLLRLCCMNPLVSTWNDQKERFDDRFAAHMVGAAVRALRHLESAGHHRKALLSAEG
jgi:glutamate/tyrosine decarboxylase-like PLP-dependent enzyme